ncbi:MAG: hypothetical protein ACOYLQ_09530 [Hyphomicrobiaceae bacterium]
MPTLDGLRDDITNTDTDREGSKAAGNLIGPRRVGSCHAGGFTGRFGCDLLLPGRRLDLRDLGAGHGFGRASVRLRGAGSGLRLTALCSGRATFCFGRHGSILC